MMMRELEDKTTKKKPHSISMEGREKISLSGAEELLSFHEEAVDIRTSMGILIIEGEALHIERLDLDAGQISIRGYILGINYEEDEARASSKGVFGRFLKK